MDQPSNQPDESGPGVNFKSTAKSYDYFNLMYLPTGRVDSGFSAEVSRTVRDMLLAGWEVAADASSRSHAAAATACERDKVSDMAAALWGSMGRDEWPTEEEAEKAGELHAYVSEAQVHASHGRLDLRAFLANHVKTGIPPDIPGRELTKASWAKQTSSVPTG
ncbi:hypothetical protein Q5752_003877 [Cryptotrichosporon argae]